MRRLRGKNGFTLIELLAVVVIITVMAGLLLPTLARARLAAKIRRAKAETLELAKAWSVYWDSYKQYPGAMTFTMNADKVAVLQGRKPAQNPDNIKLMEFGPKPPIEGFLDPWDHAYSVTFDQRAITNTWIYETKVQFVNASRYEYE